MLSCHSYCHVILSHGVATLAPHAHLPRTQVPGSAGENHYPDLESSSQTKDSLSLLRRVCFISVETVPKVAAKAAKFLGKTFGTFLLSTRLKHTPSE
jgi:hypothetical protein